MVHIRNRWAIGGGWKVYNVTFISKYFLWWKIKDVHKYYLSTYSGKPELKQRVFDFREYWLL